MSDDPSALQAVAAAAFFVVAGIFFWLGEKR